MKITIVAVGLRQPAWADSAVEDYLGRFPKDWVVSVKAVKPELRSGQSTANIMKTEAERIRAAIPHNLEAQTVSIRNSKPKLECS